MKNPHVGVESVLIRLMQMIVRNRAHSVQLQIFDVVIPHQSFLKTRFDNSRFSSAMFKASFQKKLGDNMLCCFSNLSNNHKSKSTLQSLIAFLAYHIPLGDFILRLLASKIEWFFIVVEVESLVPDHTVFVAIQIGS